MKDLPSCAESFEASSLGDFAGVASGAVSVVAVGASPELGAAGCSVCSTGAVEDAGASSDIMQRVQVGETPSVSCAWC